MEDKIDSVLSAERKADALVTEARDEAEKKIHAARADIESQHRTLEQSLTKERLQALSDARASGQEEVEKLRASEDEETNRREHKASARIDKARDFIVKALLARDASEE